MVLPSQEPPAARTIREGDLVVVYENYNSIKFVYVDSKSHYNNRYGSFAQKDWLGVRFGSRVTARGPSGGWVTLLAPTPELWTAVLRHRTQILYAADISLVIGCLGLRPGSVVLESGTGSGSLTHALARAVAPHGRVHTFDFHAGRAAEAAAEFGRHGLAGLVAGGCRNIEEDGFPPELAGAADGVFLDLPGPWRVVPSAAACLRPGAGFCAFSPCIEQVQRTCEALDRGGFVDIRTYEVLLRGYEVTAETLATDVAGAAQPNRQGKKRSRGASAATDEPGAAAGAAAAGAAAAAAAGEAAAADAAAAAAAGEAAAADAAVAAADAADGDAAAAAPAASAAPAVAAAAAAAATAPPPPPVRQVLAHPSMDARGHTGYLTFARKFVAALPLDEGSGDEGDDEDAAGEGDGVAGDGAGAADGE